MISNFEFVTGTRFDKNLKILLNVEVTFSPVYGIRLEIIEIDTSFTLGQLELERQDILRQLLVKNPETIKLVEGKFITLNKMLRMPMVIQRIALITAPNSDGQRDFLHELGSNPFGYQFKIYQYLTQIQGRNADQMIIRQLEEIEASDIPFDVVVIVRGGGSQLDFSAFETYDIGKTIAEYKKIIITGIGHERNVSIADMMSNSNLKTPTKAAAFIVDHNKAFEEEILQLQLQITGGAEELLMNAADELTRRSKRLADNCHRFIERTGNELEKHIVVVKHLNPENILARGYAMVSLNDRIVTDPQELQPGDEILVMMHHAAIHSSINSIEK